MGRFVRGWMACTLAGLLGACSSHSTRPSPSTSHEGEASYRALSDEHMDHYQLAMGSTSTGAALLDHPAPSYPATMLAACPAEVQLQALLIVGTDGKVNEVRFDKASGTAPDFAAAVRTAALGWRFEPLLISHWAADADDEAHTVGTEARPFSLPYAFRFACHAGRPEVSTASPAQN